MVELPIYFLEYCVTLCEELIWEMAVEDDLFFHPFSFSRFNRKSGRGFTLAPVSFSNGIPILI